MLSVSIFGLYIAKGMGISLPFPGQPEAPSSGSGSQGLQGQSQQSGTGSAPPAGSIPKLNPISINLEGKQPAGAVSGARAIVVEYSDYQCPFCEMAVPIIAQLEKAYPSTVSIYYKNFPLQSIHPYAQQAAVAAECASLQGRFWDYHDKLFASQQALDSKSLESYASSLGLDTASFNSCLGNGTTSKTVTADQSEGYALGVQGTPSFVVYGTSKSPAAFSRISAFADKTAQQYGGQVDVQVVEVEGAGYGVFFAGALPFDTFKGAIGAITGPSS